MLNRMFFRSLTTPNLVVAQRVLDRMTAAALRYTEDETGEALVGFVLPGDTTGVPTLYALDTIAPDASALRGWATFQQGDGVQDELIWWLQENWHVSRQKGRDAAGMPLDDKWLAPLRYLGDWHKQPGQMIHPSEGDRLTAVAWIDDPENGADFLLAPIVTTAGVAGTLPAGSNAVLMTPSDGPPLRADFWYIDRQARDFLPLLPSVYPDALLPALAAYPWDLADTTRFKAECELLEAAGRYQGLLYFDTGGAPPLDVCLVASGADSPHLTLLATPWDYPRRPPQVRLAPAQPVAPDADLYTLFGALWPGARPAPTPPGWHWTSGKHLIDYVLALEEAAR